MSEKIFILKINMKGKRKLTFSVLNFISSVLFYMFLKANAKLAISPQRGAVTLLPQERSTWKKISEVKRFSLGLFMCLTN